VRFEGNWTDPKEFALALEEAAELAGAARG